LVHERRASKRVEVSLPVHYILEAPGQSSELSVEGDTTTLNLGLGGALVKWSAWWKCPSCPLAVDSTKKPPCGLGMCQFDALDEVLVESRKMDMRIELADDTVDLAGKIIWVRKPGRRSSGSVAVEFSSLPAPVEAKLAEYVDSHIEANEEVGAAASSVGKLVVTSGPLEGTEFILEKRSFTVGRSQENDLALANLRVSREHTVLRVGEKGVMVYDLGSTNGTYVNGERVAKHLLQNNDKITIGPISMTYKAQKTVAGVVED